MPEPINVVVGSRALAQFIFGDPGKFRSVYPLREELGLFDLGGRIAGRPETIVARIKAREASEEKIED
jgi:hypothetical protein